MHLSPDEMEYLWRTFKRSSKRVSFATDVGERLSRLGMIELNRGWPTLTERGRNALALVQTDLWQQMDKRKKPGRGV